MFDFDIEHIQGSENILVDTLSRIYDGVKEEDLTREDYLLEEQKYLNTDVFLPKDTLPHMPYFTSNHNYNPYITICKDVRNISEYFGLFSYIYDGTVSHVMSHVLSHIMSHSCKSHS